MRQLLTKALLGSSLLLGAVSANAQYAQRGQYQGTPDRRDYREGDWLLNRVLSDLNRAEAIAYPNSGDKIRLDRVENMVSRFQTRLDNGEYDRQQLDRIIINMERTLDQSALPDRSRNLLADDLGRLRDLRNRLDRSYGYYNNWQQR